MRTSLLVLVALMLGCAVAQAEVNVIVTFGRSCYPVYRPAPRPCAPIWRPQPQGCGNNFYNPGYFPGTPPTNGGGNYNGGYRSGADYRLEEIRREQRQNNAAMNLDRARERAEKAYARWQGLLQCQSWPDERAFRSWQNACLSAEADFIYADKSYKEALGRYQCGGW